MEKNRRLALLIDGDNAQASLLPQMLAEVSKHGTITIRRIYGDWSELNMKSWKDAIQNYALHPEQQFRSTSGKNSTDIALIIDAMDFLYTSGIDGICIASSDSDYARLANHIREKNLFMMGIGRHHTLASFVTACDVFVFTEDLQSIAVDSDIKIEPPESIDPKENVSITTIAAIPASLKTLIRKAFDSAVQDDGWANLGPVGSFLKQLDPELDYRTYGHKGLLQLV